MVEPISLPSRQRREEALKEADYNIFNLKAEDIFIDFLTDSGTGAMTNSQWAAMMMGDESYANALSFTRFKDMISRLTGFEHVLPAHQGRAAENILIGHLLQNAAGKLVVSNQSFDTTVGHIKFNKASPYDIVIQEGLDPVADHPFKGNMDLDKLQSLLETRSDDIALITLVLTNNAGGGQPVAMDNIRAVSELAKKYNKLFFLDIARAVENAYFIQQRDPEYKHHTLEEVFRESMQYSDGVWMSAKKDASVNIGGFIALRDGELADRLKERLIMFEGFPTYGGLAGRDLEAIAVGLWEAVSTDMVAHRINQVEYFVSELHEAGIPVILPAGGHAAFIDAKSFLPHIPPEQYPGVALAAELYLEGGIRGVEIGSLMFGEHADGQFVAAPLELVRLAIPRRVYEKAHFDYVVDVLKRIKEKKDQIRGLRITEAPELLAHFTCKMAPIKDQAITVDH